MLRRDYSAMGGRKLKGGGSVFGHIVVTEFVAKSPEGAACGARGEAAFSIWSGK